MKIIKTKLSWVILASGFMFFSSAVFPASPALAMGGYGQDKAGNKRDAREWKKGDRGRDKIYEQLNLTEEQQKALQEHKQKHRENMKAIKEQLQSKTEEFRNELQQPNPDEGKIRQLNEEIKQLNNKKSDNILESILGVKNILTPEQYVKFNELRKDFRNNFKKDFNRGYKKGFKKGINRQHRRKGDGFNMECRQGG